MILTQEELIKKYGEIEACRNCIYWDEEGFCEKGKGQTLGIQGDCGQFINKHKINFQNNEG